MTIKRLTGNIVATPNGKEVSLIIPIGEYRVMVLSDDNCGEGQGNIIRSELIVFLNGTIPSKSSLNREIFGVDFVVADSDTIFTAMKYCIRMVRISK